MGRTSVRIRRISVLEGRVVISECGCWIIRAYSTGLILRHSVCAVHVGLALDRAEKELYLDKVDSVSAPTETEAQLWLT